MEVCSVRANDGEKRIKDRRRGELETNMSANSREIKKSLMRG